MKVDPNQFARCGWASESWAKVKAPPQGSATCCAQGIGGVDIRQTLDYFVVSEAFEGKIEKVDGEQASSVRI